MAKYTKKELVKSIKENFNELQALQIKLPSLFSIDDNGQLDIDDEVIAVQMKIEAAQIKHQNLTRELDKLEAGMEE